MATTFSYTVKVRVVPAAHGGGDLPGFFDMLRYERAFVTGFTAGTEAFLVDMEMAHPAELARWESFGLVPRRTGIHVEPAR